MNTATIARMGLAICLVTGSIARGGDSALADAAEQADWSRVTRLIKHDMHSVNAVQADGMTALHWAAWHDRLDMAELLLDRNASPSAANRYGVTPLALACENGNAGLVRRLLTAGADANATRPGGETALMTASRSGSLPAVQSLLKHKANPDARERTGQTAVMWAAAEGHAHVVSVLITAGADFQRPLKSGFTPLFFAAREGQSGVMTVLLKAGCDVNSVMRPTVDGGRIVRSGTGALMLAMENGHFELAVELLKAGADANDQRSGFTLLHAITWVRKPNRGDGVDGDPPPIGSGNLTSLQFVRKLVEYGADVNRKLKRGRSGRGNLSHRGATPFLFAADTADVPLMKLLLELGADPTVGNTDNCPPLLAAAGIGTRAPGEEAGTEAEALAAVKYLLTLGADINAV
ncbi:MAG: ankyrin repeat domain-containing protein, partial [Planctomycetaceae bacterium]